MVRRTIFDHDESYAEFRALAAAFLEREVIPFHGQWEDEGLVPRDVWTKAGELGLLCCEVPEEYGGIGGTFLHSAIVMEELMRAGATGLAFANHSDVVTPYIQRYGTEQQRRRWLPELASGRALAAICMTEPSGGSDLANLRTTARRVGDKFVLRGQKVFITNSTNADLFIVAAKTDVDAPRGKGISLLLVEHASDGVRVGSPLKKIGYKASDTCEVYFDDVEVPAENILGVEGEGFAQLMTQLAQERMTQGVRAVAMARRALELTIDYVKQRDMFGKTLADMQNTQFTLANLHAEIELNQVYLDRCLELLLTDELSAEDAAICKMTSTEMLGRVADQCLQLFGGWGYMWEYPIARIFVDARMARIAGGTVETMKHIIGRNLVR